MASQDLILVIGIVIVGLAIPAILGALAERRTPRIATILIVTGGALILIALSQRPGGYGWADIPEAFVRVLAYFIR